MNKKPRKFRGIAKFTIYVGQLPATEVLAHVEKYKKLWEPNVSKLKEHGFEVIFFPSHTRDMDLEIIQIN